jgi:hypothetical protein
MSSLSVQGDKGIWRYEYPQPNGEVQKRSITVERISGGPRVPGRWKITEIKPEIKGAPPMLEIATALPDRITLKLPGAKRECQGKFDGKEYPVLLDGTASDRTSSFERLGEFSFKVTNSLQGKPLYVDRFTLSEDGQTLTLDSKPVAADEPTQVIFRRQ